MFGFLIRETATMSNQSMVRDLQDEIKILSSILKSNSYLQSGLKPSVKQQLLEQRLQLIDAELSQHGLRSTDHVRIYIQSSLDILTFIHLI